ncbi:alpha/beta hydrolase [Cohnella sp. CFH 77786]|uniref:alpha/beta hydrolase n=1 Tax=Cohnella sp. CFH 77786 TaxID=2662265 RepID=UPI00351D8F75
MDVVIAGVGAAGCLIAAGAAGLYGLTVKAQQPRLLPNTARPTVPYETVEWDSEGRMVRGWMLPQPGAVKPPAVLVVHGWGSNRSRVLRYALPLHEAGYAVLMYDARGHGDSDSYPTPSGLMFKEDFLTALNWLRRRPDIDPGRIGVIGHSLGGFGAVLALEEGAQIQALVTDSMPVRFSTMIGSELRRRRLPEFPLAYLIPYLMIRRSRIPRSAVKRADPAAILADPARGRNVPVLLIHSRKDSYVPAAELEYVLSQAPDLPHLFVESEGHSSSDRDPAFWPAVTAFFSAHLLPEQRK